MRCVVFGATGYLGSRVVRKLLRQGDDVLCVVRRTSVLDNLEDISDCVRFCEMEQLSDFLIASDPYDCVVNLACQYPRNSSTDMDMFEANLMNPLSVLTTCLRNGVRKIVTIGTGLPDELNAYAMSKAKLSEILKWYAHQYRLQGESVCVCNVKLENFYGEDEPTNRFIPGTVAKLKRNEKILLTEGTQVRDFVYVEDVLNNLTAVIHRQDLPEYLDLPLGSGEGVSIRELITYLKELLGSTSELCFGAVPSRINEPDSVADKQIMEHYCLTVQYSWKVGMKKFL